MKLAHPIEDTPFINERWAVIKEYYLPSTNFSLAVTYPSDTPLLNGEVGYIGIPSGAVVYPVARICAVFPDAKLS